MNPTLHTLEWEYTPDYELLGVSSGAGCHRLAWSMNRAFGWELTCDQDVIVSQGKKEDTVHPTADAVQSSINGNLGPYIR